MDIDSASSEVGVEVDERAVAAVTFAEIAKGKMLSTTLQRTVRPL